VPLLPAAVVSVQRGHNLRPSQASTASAKTDTLLNVAFPEGVVAGPARPPRHKGMDLTILVPASSAVEHNNRLRTTWKCLSGKGMNGPNGVFSDTTIASPNIVSLSLSGGLARFRPSSAWNLGVPIYCPVMPHRVMAFYTQHSIAFGSTAKSKFQSHRVTCDIIGRPWFFLLLHARARTRERTASSMHMLAEGTDGGPPLSSCCHRCGFSRQVQMETLYSRVRR